MEYYSKKSIWKWILLYVLIGAAVYGLIYYFFFYRNRGYNYTSQQNQDDYSNQISDWKTYYSEKYGFEIKYPINWELELINTEQYDGVIMKINNIFSNSYLRFSTVANPDNLTIDEWFLEAINVDGYPSPLAGAKPITVNGFRGYQVYNNLKSPNPLFHIIITNEKRDIVSMYAYIGETTDNQILEQMSSTFKFID